MTAKQEAREAAGGRFARLASAMRSDAYFPSHVKHCANNPDRVGRWTLAFWPKSRPLDSTRVAYTCGSVRCPSPECQRAAAHRDFAKIRDGIERVGCDGWVYMVLTIDQHSTLAARASGKPWANEQEAFRELSRMTRNFLGRLRRHFRSSGWAPLRHWVATVEVQRNGWPHLNLMIHSPALADDIDNAAQGAKDPRALRGWLLSDAVACDWGTIGVAERAVRTEALAGYLVKKADTFHRKTGEIAKLTQAPTNARMKLRRIRASRGFMAPRARSGEWTGIMFRRQKYVAAVALDDWGRVVQTRVEYRAEPLMRPDQVRCPVEEQANYLAGVTESMRAEQEQIVSELRGAPELLRDEPLGVRERRVLGVFGSILSERRLLLYERTG